LSAGYYDAYGQAQRVRTLIKQDFDRAFAQVDVIACPVTPTTAFPIGGHGDDPLSMYLEDVFTLPANLAGVPGLAFPVGFDTEGLPIGMQLNGPALSEPLLLRLCDAYQRETEWHRCSPGLGTRLASLRVAARIPLRLSGISALSRGAGMTLGSALQVCHSERAPPGAL
jgi:aspartyl-tRNA(Asn)/glutamyl-tRNA(Gln) amidotransferase subunit A